MAGRPSFADFVADDAANGCAADCSEHTAARKDGTANGTDASANGGVLALRRHARTTTEGEQYGYGNCTEGDSLRLFHGITSFLNVLLPVLRARSSTIHDSASPGAIAGGPDRHPADIAGRLTRMAYRTSRFFRCLSAGAHSRQSRGELPLASPGRFRARPRAARGQDAG